MNPFTNMTATASRALTLAYDRCGGRGAGLMLLGLDDKTIRDTWRTADALHNRYGSVEAVVQRLDRMALDRRMAMDAMPGNGRAGKLSPEAALKALRSHGRG